MKRVLSLILAVFFLTSALSPAFATTEDATPDSGGASLAIDSSMPLGLSGEISSVADSGTPPEPPPNVVTDPPALAAELVAEGDAPGLYITLKNAPQDLSEVHVNYLFGHNDFESMALIPRVWYTNPDEGDALCQVDEDGSVRLLCYQADEHPLSAYLAEAVNTLWIQVSYFSENSGRMEFDPVRFSHEKTYEIPDTPPPFTANFELGWFSYTVVGHFSAFAPNVAQVSSTYSWDGVNYQSCGSSGPMRWDLQKLGSEDAAAKARLQNQECAKYYAEPLKSFLAHKRDSFYLRLEITTEEGEVFYSQPALMSRGEAVEIPEHLTPRAYMGFNMAVTESRNDKGLAEDDGNYYAELVNYTYGQLQLTVREDVTPEEIMALLPDTVPIRVRFWDKETNQKVAFGDVACKVSWKKLPAFSLTAGEPLTLEDVAEPLVIPAGTTIETDLAAYTVTKPLTFHSLYDSDDIRLILNPVAVDEEPQVGLRAGEDWNGNDVMSLAFWQKPSGATAVEAYALVGEERTLICDLLDRRDVNHNQSHALYGYVPLLYAEETPYADHLSETLESFTIELEIKGGVYDGQTVTLPWPQDYELPEEVFDPSGGEGQENNAGSGNGNGDSTEGGQRPDLPDDPTDETNPPPPTRPGGETGGGGNSSGDPSRPTPPAKPAPPPAIPAAVQPVEPSAVSADTASASSDTPEEQEKLPVPKAVASAPTQEEPLPAASAVGTVATPPAQRTTDHLPVPVTLALVVLGGGAAAFIGTAGVGATSSGGVGKLLVALRKLVFRK